MEKLEKIISRGWSVFVTPIQQTGKTYMAPKVLQVLVVEAVMTTVGASGTGSLNEPTTGISEEAKEQDFFYFPEETQEDPWSE